MPSEPDRLSASGKPLFFKAEGAGVAAALPPPIRPDRGEAVRVLVRSLTAMQKEALVISARTGSVWRLASDEGAYLDGHDIAPCPLAHFSTGMVSSYMNEILALAKQRGMDLRTITLVLDNYYTMKGSMLAGTMTGGARDVGLEVIPDTDASDDEVRALACDAVAASALNGLMRGARESLFTLSHNGREIAAAKARPVGRPAEPDPVELFDRARPAACDWSTLVRRGGPSPKNEHTSTFAGGSLAEHQDRLLHVRAICRLRHDGVKQIEQHLYNPHGSVFHFLSDEAPGNGGRGFAPDAASYLSAGIGFCFMTQLGRYAKIVKARLDSYGIVQDTHYSLGGASGGTGKAGVADPIETHVHLRSGEDDDVARTCLDMSEQTCFLHAFCRTDLKAHIKVTRQLAVGGGCDQVDLESARAARSAGDKQIEPGKARILEGADHRPNKVIQPKNRV